VAGRSLAVIAAVVGGGLALARPEPTPVPVVPEPIVEALDRALHDWLAAPGHVGVTAAVILPDGARWEAAVGAASPDEPLTVDYRMPIASITKTMTGGVALTLVDEGVLRLDDPIGRWLGALRNVDPRITIRQLLTHSAGLANFAENTTLQRLAAADHTRVFTAEELVSYTGPPVAPPGVRTQYTNTATVLLALVAERATGRAIVELYHQRLWDPLELREVYFPGYEEPTPPVAWTFGTIGWFRSETRISQLTAGHAAGGLVATARDVATWGRALFAGTVISDDLQMSMRELRPAAGNIPGESGVGLGIRGYGFFDRVQYGHSGGGAFNSSLLLFDPDSGVTVAVLMNQALNAAHFELAPRLLAIAAQ
jgi:D-alanyl-D-alanine carboxypeptidase